MKVQAKMSDYSVKQSVTAPTWCSGTHRFTARKQQPDKTNWRQTACTM